ncbi:hypothetical protein ACJZ2D_015095 [Fusarium nematophilum]
MDEIYQKIAEFNPQRLTQSPDTLTFDVTELWHSHATGIVNAYDRPVAVPNAEVSSWLAEERRTSPVTGQEESLVLRLVWPKVNLEKLRVELPEAVQKSILAKFGLELAFSYFSSCLAGVNAFPEVVKPEGVEQAHAFCYVPKIAAIWSHARFNSPSSGRQTATNGILFVQDKQKETLQRLLRSKKKWQLATASHAMFPAFLMSFMLAQEIELTQFGMKEPIQEVEKRTGYQNFSTQRKEAASGELGELSALMSGYASKLASAERKSRTLEKLNEFIWRMSPLEQGSTEANAIMRNHVGVLKDRLSHQALDRQYMLKRVQIQIEALVNLIAQNDSINNFDIALSSHRDASSMKTLAVVTMLFLPGSFVAAIFSTDLFDWQSVESSGSIGVPSTPRFRLYWAVTVPLTVIVFVLYFAWLAFSSRQRRRKNHKAGQGTGSNEGPSTGSQPVERTPTGRRERVEAHLLAQRRQSVYHSAGKDEST